LNLTWVGRAAQAEAPLGRLIGVKRECLVLNVGKQKVAAADEAAHLIQLLWRYVQLLLEERGVLVRPAAGRKYLRR
jgi:hypothetical protein